MFYLKSFFYFRLFDVKNIRKRPTTVFEIIVQEFFNFTISKDFDAIQFIHPRYIIHFEIKNVCFTAKII